MVRDTEREIFVFIPMRFLVFFSSFFPHFFLFGKSALAFSRPKEQVMDGQPKDGPRHVLVLLFLFCHGKLRFHLSTLQAPGFPKVALLLCVVPYTVHPLHISTHCYLHPAACG